MKHFFNKKTGCDKTLPSTKCLSIWHENFDISAESRKSHGSTAPRLHGSMAPRLHGSEPEEDFAFYVTFEEGLVICINNPDSAKFSVHRVSTVKGIALLQLKFPRHTQCRAQKLQLVLIVLKEEGL